MCSVSYGGYISYKHIRFTMGCSHVTDFNARDTILTAVSKTSIYFLKIVLLKL